MQKFIDYDQVGVSGTERLDINVGDVGTATEAGAAVALTATGS